MHGKEKTMKRKIKKILAGITAIAIILLLYNTITSFYGNPFIFMKMDTIVEDYMKENYPTLDYTIEDMSYELKHNRYTAHLKNTDYDKGHTYTVNYSPRTNYVYDDYFTDVCNTLHEDYSDLVKGMGIENNEYSLWPDCDSKNFTLGMSCEETARQIKAIFTYNGYDKGDEDFYIYNLDEVEQHIAKMEELLKDVDVNVQTYQIIFMEIPVKYAHNTIELQKIVDDYAKDRQELMEFNKKKNTK